MPRRRLLFLHGMACPPAAYERHIAPKLLQALERGGYDVTFLRSPRPYGGDVPQWAKDLMPSIADDDHPEWYNAHEKDDGTKVLDGLPDTLKFVRAFVAQQDAPFDAVLGHSQGAQLAAIVTLLAESSDGGEGAYRTKDGRVPWKLAVLLSGPNPFDTEATLAETVRRHGHIQTPSLHVYGGEKDFTLEGAKAMRRVHFNDGEGGNENVREFHHDQGHFGPDDDEAMCTELVATMSEMLEAMGE